MKYNTLPLSHVLCVWRGLAYEIRYAAKVKAAAEATCTLSETRYRTVLLPCVVSVCVHVSAHLLHIKCQEHSPRKVGPFWLVLTTSKESLRVRFSFKVRIGFRLGLGSGG